MCFGLPTCFMLRSAPEGSEPFTNLGARGQGYECIKGPVLVPFQHCATCLDWGHFTFDCLKWPNRGAVAEKPEWGTSRPILAGSRFQILVLSRACEELVVSGNAKLRARCQNLTHLSRSGFPPFQSGAMLQTQTGVHKICPVMRRHKKTTSNVQFQAIC